MRGPSLAAPARQAPGALFRIVNSVRHAGATGALRAGGEARPR